MKYVITAPDGQKYEVTAPDGTPESEVLAYAQKQFASASKPEGSYLSQMVGNIPQSAGKLVGGLATAIMNPLDTAGAVALAGEGAARKIVPKSVTDYIDAIGNTGLGKKADQVASAIGSEYANRYGGMENIAETLKTDPVGMAADVSTLLGIGSAMTPGKVSSVLGKASTYTNPLSVLKPLAPVADLAAEKLMASALKPTVKQWSTGAAETAIKTALDKGINPTRGGVDKLNRLIDEKNAQIASEIAGSTADVSKRQAAMPLLDTLSQYSKQVSPASDLDAIRKTGLEFLSHPNYPGSTLPVQAAQELKQGTYRILAKKYGQVGSAETEAQKAIARGLKDQVAAAVPAVKGLNAEESALIKTLDVVERRALMGLNNNPGGLAWMAQNPKAAVGFLADRSPLFKSLAARMFHSARADPQLLMYGAQSGLLSQEQ